MKVKLVGSSTEGAPEKQFLTTLVINDVLAVDAGALGFAGEPDEQAAIRHVLISHTHIDHIASLPIFLENVFNPDPDDCPTIYATQPVLDGLRKYVFNDWVWPDFFRIGAENNLPFVDTEVITPEQTIEIAGHQVTPVEVNHGLPTCGFIVEREGSAIAVASDTAPTNDIWRLANANPNLKAVFLDASFPDSLATLADASKHLTPSRFAEEVRKLERDVPTFAVHVKARFREQVVAELRELGIPKLEITTPGKEYLL